MTQLSSNPTLKEMFEATKQIAQHMENNMPDTEVRYFTLTVDELKCLQAVLEYTMNGFVQREEESLIPGVEDAKRKFENHLDAVMSKLNKATLNTYPYSIRDGYKRDILLKIKEDTKKVLLNKDKYKPEAVTAAMNDWKVLRSAFCAADPIADDIKQLNMESEAWNLEK
jgi:hypothetical protein